MKKTAKKKLYVSSESVALLSAAGYKLVAGAGSGGCTTEDPGKSLCFQGCQTGDPCLA